MHHRLRLWVVALSSAAAVATHASADSIQCGQSVVNERMTSYVVRQRCGEPDSIERVDVPILERPRDGIAAGVGTRVREYWTYGRGWGKFPARITIEDGIVTRIELLASR